MKKIAVGDLMTRSLITAKPNSNLHECAKTMVNKRVNNLLVADNRKLVGILTERDILWTITKKPGIDLKKINAVDIASKKVAVIKPSAELNQAFRKMKKLNFRRLPVISKGELVGMLTLKDILKVDPSLYSETGELHSIREETQKLKQASLNLPEEGICEECGSFDDLLKVYGLLLCPDCREELH